MSPGRDDEPTPADAEDGRVLSPDELDISDDERVKELDDGRYVISSGDPIADTGSEPSSVESGTHEATPELRGDTSDSRPTPRSPPEPEPEPESGRTTEPTSAIAREDVHEWLSEDLGNANSRYGFDITASFDGSTSQQRMVSNDVVTIFETLVMWYAQQIDRNTPVEEVLGLLLVEANVPVRYPAASLKRTLKSEGLTPEDSIGELLKVVDANDGLEM